MASWTEYVEEEDATMVATAKASAERRRRVFLSKDGLQLKLIDELGNISLIATVFVQGIHKPVVDFAASPYAAVVNETVKVLTTAPDGGDIIVNLPSAVGNAGLLVKVVSVTPPFSGVLPGGHKVRINADGPDLINGVAFKELTNAGENLNLESDGTDWIITG